MSPVSGQIPPPSNRPVEPESKIEEHVEASPIGPRASRLGPVAEFSPKPGPIRAPK